MTPSSHFLCVRWSLGSQSPTLKEKEKRVQGLRTYKWDNVHRKCDVPVNAVLVRNVFIFITVFVSRTRIEFVKFLGY